MPEITADKDYFLDEQGKVTTDSTKAAHWLAKKGGIISIEVQDKYGIPTASEEEGSSEKADEPKENKKATPSKNKGVK